MATPYESDFLAKIHEFLRRSFKATLAEPIDGPLDEARTLLSNATGVISFHARFTAEFRRRHTWEEFVAVMNGVVEPTAPPPVANRVPCRCHAAAHAPRAIRAIPLGCPTDEEMAFGSPPAFICR